jgi:hypothetical protein
MEVIQALQKHKQVLKWRKASKVTQKTLEDFWGARTRRRSILRREGAAGRRSADFGPKTKTGYTRPLTAIHFAVGVAHFRWDEFGDGWK